MYKKVITVGTAMASLSVLSLLLGSIGAAGQPHHRAADFWRGDYWPFIIFMILFSLGEAVWSARFTAYLLQVAPRDQKAAYLAVAGIPPLLGRLASAGHSAWMVGYYCPSADQCSAGSIWLTVWLLSCITPTLLTLGGQVLNPEQHSV